MNEKPGVINVNALCSAEPGVRLRELLSAYNQWRPKLRNYIHGQTGNREDTQDLLQQLYLNMHRTLNKRPLRADRDPEAYVFTAADNLCIDLWRAKEKQRKFVASGGEKQLQVKGRHFYRRRVEEEFLGRLGWQELTALCLRLQSDQDRVVALLHHVLSYKPNQICYATGRPEPQTHNQLRRIGRELRKKRDTIYEHLGSVSEWEELLWFADDQLPLCVSNLNVLPTNIAPESLGELAKDLGVKSVHELRDRFISCLFIEGINTVVPGARMFFIPRADLGPEALMGDSPATYLEYLLSFYRASEGGGWKEYLWLTKNAEYPARMRGSYYDRENHMVGWDCQ